MRFVRLAIFAIFLTAGGVVAAHAQPPKGQQEKPPKENAPIKPQETKKPRGGENQNPNQNEKPKKPQVFFNLDDRSRTTLLARR